MSVKSVHASRSSAHPDGPIDVTMNVNYLRVDIKETRRGQYQKFVNPNKQTVTAAGTILPFTLNLSRANLFHYQVRKWLKDGQVSVAQNACSLCIEINSLRPPHRPALCCLVKAKNHLDSTDGNAACALCYSIGNFQCSSQARFPSITTHLGKSTSIDLVRSTSISRSTSIQGINGQIDHKTFLDSPPLDTMHSVDETLGGSSAPDAMLRNKRRQFNQSTSSRPMSAEGSSYDREMIPSSTFGIHGRRRTISEMANNQRRKAHFTKTTELDDQLEAIEVLTSQMDELQMQVGQESQKWINVEERVKSQMELMNNVIKKLDQHDAEMEKLQTSNLDQNNVKYHLAKLVEVVDELQKSINEQKKDVQSIKQVYMGATSASAGSRQDLVPAQQRVYPAANTSVSLETLKKFIEDNEEKQRQRKAMYLERLNLELAQNIVNEEDSINAGNALFPRSIDM